MVISKFSQRDEYYTSYDAYVLVVNNKTAEIANKFVEKNAWISDKVKVSKIVIDTAPYILSKGNRAFGIRVEFGNRSKASLYDMTELSLFVKEKKTLSCVLKKYPILKYNGEMIFGCIQYSKGVEAVMSIGKEVSKSIRKKARRKISKSIITDKTNTFSDIFMKEKITIIENKGVNYDCEEKEKTESRIIRLSYNGKEYVPL